jgi:hypothetical protein
LQQQSSGSGCKKPDAGFHIVCCTGCHAPAASTLTNLTSPTGAHSCCLLCSRVSTPVKRKNRDFGGGRDYGSGQINAYPPVAPGGAVAGAAMMTLAEELLSKKGLSLKQLQVRGASRAGNHMTLACCPPCADGCSCTSSCMCCTGSLDRSISCQHGLQADMLLWGYLAHTPWCASHKQHPGCLLQPLSTTDKHWPAAPYPPTHPPTHPTHRRSRRSMRRRVTSRSSRRASAP